MSALSYRTWDIWVNSGFYESDQQLDGYFECSVVPVAMVPQTVEFLAESFEVRARRLLPIGRARPEIIRHAITSEDGQLCIRLYESLDTSVDKNELIEGVNRFIEALSLATDSSLICQKIRFISHQYGKLLTAFRRPIGRGIGFEIEERAVASTKLTTDLDYYEDETDTSLLVGRRHYLAGMQLLSLEDQIAGLLDAAFMQFYQGCEVLCRHPKGELEASKIFIAGKRVPDGRDLQIIAHQVWRVRNKYFGHGDVTYNLRANLGIVTASAVAKQVLVVRYLCRRLLDLSAPSGKHLNREMHLYFNEGSGSFRGTVGELEGPFRVDFDRRDSNIYDGSGTRIGICAIS